MQNFDWPHAPVHRLGEAGTFMVTAATYRKEHFFREADRLDFLQERLLGLAGEYEWQLEAWAIFSNHYHFVGHALESADTLRPFMRHLHATTAREMNRLDRVRGRKVWYNYWDTKLTFQKSYLARLNYVHQNAVRHGLVRDAEQYQWCSASWFHHAATPAQVATIHGFKIDRVNVVDDFDVATVL